MRIVVLLCGLLLLTSCASSWKNVYTTDYSETVRYGARLVELKQYANALLVYERLLEQAKDPQHKAALYNNIAVVTELTGDYIKAREMYKKALEINADPAIFENYKRFAGEL